MLIRAKNTLSQKAQKTFFTHDEAAGVTVVRWKNPNGFTKSWAIQLGETGEEQTEVRILSTETVAGTAGTITAATDFEHPADTPIYAIKFDQTVFSVSTGGTAGAATVISGGTVSYTPDSKFTVFDFTTGTATDAYKSNFRASVLDVNSLLSDFITSAGFNFYSLGRIRQRVRGRLFDSSFVTDDDVDNWVNEWKERMTNAAISVNEDFSLGTVDVGFGTDGLGTITSEDFKQVRRMWISYNGSDKFMATKMFINDFRPNEDFVDASPFFAMKGENVFQVKPEKSGGTAEIFYYKLDSVLQNDTDELPQSMKGYSKSFVNYCVSQALLKDNKGDLALREEGKAEAELARFKKEITPRSQTGPTYIDIVDSLGGEDEFLLL